ncbi:Glycoside hydrolase family 79 protein [Mycena venus]|uniref:Glycoside hydrolase family 79 protein n=1 Tax=Mycena venus TaxID=2733690 RepID=A0A8H6YCC5_9AGAR|nr:Glycoside hydrolase family 79 protein [Mycena venus]
MRLFIQFFLFILAAALPASSLAAVKFNPPATPDKARTVAQGYIGFGIEMKSFPDYVGHSTPNKLSKFLLSQLSARTGNSPVHIRVGGTSMDNGVFSPSLTTNATLPASNLAQCRLHTNITIGAPWVRAFEHLGAALARYTLQVPLARKNVPNGVKLADACVKAMPGGPAQLDAIEIGNEPNLYPFAGCGGHDRGPDFTPEVYASGWNAYAQNLQKGVEGLGSSPKRYQALALASNADLGLWNLSKIFKQLDQGGHVKTVSQHYYQGLATGTLKAQLLTHSTTVSKMEHNFRANVEFSHAHNISLVFGEVGPALGGNGDINPALFGTLGGALWSFDFLLYGMSMGITRVSMQLGTNFRMSAWQAVDGEKGHPKAVHGNFYGLVAGADFIGPAGDLKIRTLPMDDHPDIVGYAGYNSGKLTKVAVLNLQIWNKGDGARPQREIALTKLGADVKRVRVSRLTSPDGATDEDNISWAGEQFTAENDGTVKAKGDKPAIINVTNGSPVKPVVVAASEAVLIEVLRN